MIETLTLKQLLNMENEIILKKEKIITNLNEQIKVLSHFLIKEQKKKKNKDFSLEKEIAIRKKDLEAYREYENINKQHKKITSEIQIRKKAIRKSNLFWIMLITDLLIKYTNKEWYLKILEYNHQDNTDYFLCLINDDTNLDLNWNLLFEQYISDKKLLDNIFVFDMQKAKISNAYFSKQAKIKPNYLFNDEYLETEVLNYINKNLNIKKRSY